MWPMPPRGASAVRPPVSEHARTTPDPLRHIARVCAAISVRQRVRRGDLIVRAGQPFERLNWLGSGLLSSTGQRVMGFHLPGDIIGMEGVSRGVHPFDVRALEDSNVRQAPFGLIEQLATTEPQLLMALHRVMSHELHRQQQLASVLTCPSAEGRLAAFLVDLWARRRAVDEHAFVLLTVGRADIGSYLGLTMESISRGFARLAVRGFIDVRRRRLRVVDMPGLRAFAARQTSTITHDMDQLGGEAS